MCDALEFATQLAKDAGSILQKFYNPNGIKADLKTDGTVITEADVASNNLIQESIKQNFPDDGILSEEGDTIFPYDRNYVWVIDPLDGTTNFSLGLHHWGVSIARLKDGIPNVAALYFPVLNELFTSSQGGGAIFNGSELLHCHSKTGSPETFFSCCSRTHAHYHVEIPFKTRMLGSAAYGLITVVKGSAKLAFEGTPKVWDYAGSWLITTEAGGIIKSLDGNCLFPLIPGEDYGQRSNPVLAAGSVQDWNFGQRRIQNK